MFGIISVLINKYIELLTSYGLDLEFVFELFNSWRVTPYFPSNHFIKYLKEHGVPVCMKDYTQFPTDPLCLDIEEYSNQRIHKLSAIYCMINMELGIPYKYSLQILLEMHSGEITI